MILKLDECIAPAAVISFFLSETHIYLGGLRVWFVEHIKPKLTSCQVLLLKPIPVILHQLKHLLHLLERIIRQI